MSRHAYEVCEARYEKRADPIRRAVLSGDAVDNTGSFELFIRGPSCVPAVPLRDGYKFQFAGVNKLMFLAGWKISGALL